MIQAGDIVRTSYDQRPMVVIEVVSDCRCPDYLTQIDCDGKPCAHERNCDEHCPLTRDDPAHLHIVCVLAEVHAKGKWRKEHHRYYGGYIHISPARLRNIWRTTPSGELDEIDIIEHVPGSQCELLLRAK